MIEVGETAPPFVLDRVDGEPWRFEAAGGPRLFVFFETDCPTCRLIVPYLNRLSRACDLVDVVAGISQDGLRATRRFLEEVPAEFPILLDGRLAVSRIYNPDTVPTLFLVDRGGYVARVESGFDKQTLNAVGALLARELGKEPLEIAPQFDGAPEQKPGCMSRHLEPTMPGEESEEPGPAVARPGRARRIELADGIDPYDHAMQAFGDPLPVVPPTVERVDRMLAAVALDPSEVIAHVPPNYGAATVEKIAANAVMAGCVPAMLPVLLTVVRAACDERFNLHGVQATTHFAAPLVIVNGPIRRALGFASGSNVFSNVARANSTLGRALQLVLTNLGGARPGEIDMSTLGNPGKFSFVIAENEEASPWEPLHPVSAVTLFAADPPRGVSEHAARSGREVLEAIARVLATVWSFRVCAAAEALMVLSPEHARTVARDGFGKEDARRFLFDNTAIPVAAYREGDTGDGVAQRGAYEEIVVAGERCYRKFRTPDALRIIVAGGTAGKFSAVLGSWATGPRGSESVTYPIEAIP